MKINSFFNILDFFVNSFDETSEVFIEEDIFKSYMWQMGWKVDSLPAQYSNIYTAIRTCVDEYYSIKESSEIGPEDLITLIDNLRGIYTAIQNISAVPGGVSSPTDFLEDLKHYFVYLIFIRYLSLTVPSVYNFLRTINVIKTSEENPLSTSLNLRYDLEFTPLKEFISNPANFVKGILGWGTTDFIPSLIVRKLYSFLLSINSNSTYSLLDPEDVFRLDEFNSSENEVSATIYLPLYSFYDPGGIIRSIGFKIILGSDPTLSEPFLSLIPDLPAGLSYQMPINDELSLSFKLNTDLQDQFLVYISPSQQSVQYLNSGSILPNIGFGVTLSYRPDSPFYLLGNSYGSNMNFSGGDISFDISRFNEEWEFSVGILVKQLEIILKGGDGDSFLNSIISGEKRIPIDLGLSWSSISGLHFTGSGGFEIELKPHLKLGPISVDGMKVRLYATADNPGGVIAEGSTGLSIDLGAIKCTVQNVGLRLKFLFSEGNIGPFDINIGFKPPTGAGLAIDAPPIKGGGFLNYDEATSTYTGGLELTFSKIAFSAIGIISTKLPGGADGYSLLIIISAEFTPIQLGMGFTLNGIGGILGLHRTMNPDVLRTGIRDNTLDHILFPTDIVKNANTIISNIGQAFPIKQDQFLVGPMVKIGWGTPTLLTIELGIIIELPDPVRLAILGVVKALLPNKDNPIIQIQVNFLGIIDFTNKYLSFDASLYDSKILTFGLFGDMALRLYWGDKPSFLLSVGGFHPKFTPPPLGLPQMQRLTIVLANYDNLKIAIETYFAITSNSVQFGAKVAAAARAWKIEAVGALWFDILFQFSPFYFIADMGVMFAIRMGKKTLLSIYMDMALEGPDPWRARGRASFKVLFVKVNVSFDKTFGQSRVEAIEAASTQDPLVAALSDPSSWEALLPERNSRQVSWREQAETENMSVDPAGAIKLSQRVLPFNITLQKFGTAAINDNIRYDITGISTGSGNLPTQNVQDYFARNEFFYMTDEEKLSRDSYELFDSGIIAGDSSIRSEYAVHRKCSYEEITIDSGYRRPEPQPYEIPLPRYEAQQFGNYISASGLSIFASIPTSEGPNRVIVSKEAEEFIVMDGSTLGTVAGPFFNSVDAERYLAVQLATNPATAAQWIVANKYEQTGML